MRACPYCSRTMQDEGTFCPFCGNNLAAAMPGGMPMPPGANPETSGKAIGSLICGILFFLLPSAILAVVLGHLSLAEIKRSAGRLTGKGMASVGLALGYLGISFIPLLIIAAILIPNLLRARMAANEASAVGSLRTINMACVSYESEYKTYPASLEKLGAETEQNAEKANLVDAQLATGLKNGYRFTYEAGPATDGETMAFTVHADPINPNVTGSRYFFTDQTGVIRVSIKGPADENSPPIQ